MVMEMALGAARGRDGGVKADGIGRNPEGQQKTTEWKKGKERDT